MLFQNPVCRSRFSFNRILLPLFLLIPFFAGCSRSDEYPNRPITLVCPWSVGGGTDLCSRQMAYYLKEELGVPVNVINATGGRGVTGHSRSLKARPDGYTIGTITLELNMLHWQGLTNLTYKDAELLFSFNEDAAAVFVPYDSPMNTMQDLVDEIKKNPGKIRISGSATGAAWHVAFVGWLESIELDSTAVKWIPMGGAGPSLQELISGGLDMVCCSLPETDALYRAKKLKCLGVMDEERTPGYPEVATLPEQGFDWTMVGWRGIAVPIGTPQPIIDRLSVAIERIVKGETKINGKTFPEFLASKNYNGKWRKGEDFEAFLATMDDKFGKMLMSDTFKAISKSPIGPSVFPNLIIGIMVILLAILGVKKFVLKSSEPTLPEEEKETLVNEGGLVNALLVFVGIIAYLLFAEQLGFIVMASIILFVLLWRLGTNFILSAVITVIFIPGLYFIFTEGLRVPLPIGILG